jgi:hypothetical protein
MRARDSAAHNERKRAHQTYSALHPFHAAFLHQSLRQGTVALMRQQRGANRVRRLNRSASTAHYGADRQRTGAQVAAGIIPS